MTSPEGDKDIDDYLHRGSDESRRYRALSQEEPPADLDRAVLTQARAAVASVSAEAPPSRSRKRTQWMVPFALAASVLLTFAVFREGADETGVRFEAPLAPASAPMSVEPAEESEATAAEAMADSVAEVAGGGGAEEKASAPVERSLRAPIPQTREQSAARDGVPAQASGASAPAIERTEPPPPSPQAAPAEPPSVPSVATFTGQRATVPAPSQSEAARRATAERALAETTVAQSAVASQDAARLQEPVRTPEAWLEEIRKLRAGNNSDEADAELLLFMVAYPDYFRQNPGVASP